MGRRTTHKRRRQPKRKQSRRRKRGNSHRSLPNCPTFPKLYSTQKRTYAGKNFFEHINGKWLNSVHLGGSESARSVSSEVQATINKKLLNVIIKCIKKPYNADRKAIANFAQALHNKHSGDITQKTLQILLNQVDCLTDPTKNSENTLQIQVARIMGMRAYNGMFTLFSIGESPEEKDTKHIRMHISITASGLPKKEYYTKKKIFNYYKYFLKTVGAAFHYEGLDRFVDLEKKYIHILDNAEDEDTITIHGKTIQSLTPAIPWEVFWNEIGIQKAELEKQKINIYSKKWLQYANKMFKT